MIDELIFILSIILLLLIVRVAKQQNEFIEKYNLLKEFYTYEKIKRAIEDKGLKLVMLKQTPKGHSYVVDLEGVEEI